VVKVYSLATCAPCKTVKYLLTSKNKEHEVIDCTDNPDLREEAFRLSGSMMMPVVVIGGTVISGGNIPLIASMLK
jgi:glutaredoxin